jgi:hypothetical protein
MGRCVLWALGIVFGLALSASPVAAQVDVGVWTPNGGGRVILGAPRVYYPPPPVYVSPAPVYVDPYYYYRPYYRSYPRGYVNFGRPYYGYSRYPGRSYRGNAYGRSYYRDDRYYRGGDRNYRRGGADRNYRGGGGRSRGRR